MGWKQRNHGSIPGRGKKIFSSPKCPYQLYGPFSLPLNGYHRQFYSGKVAKA
jgi:hypothetical protein